MLEDLSIGEILLILFVAVIFFGPKKIPDLAQSIGKGIREFKKAMRDVSDEIQKPSDDDKNLSRIRGSQPTYLPSPIQNQPPSKSPKPE